MAYYRMYHSGFAEEMSARRRAQRAQLIASYVWIGSISFFGGMVAFAWMIAQVI